MAAPGPDLLGGWPTGSFLGRLCEDDRLALLQLGTPRHFAVGERLMNEGHPGDDVIVLTHGCVRVVGGGLAGRETLLSFRVGGDILGEVGLLDRGPRSASIIAAVPTRGRRIGYAVFNGFLRERPRADTVFRAVVAAKLRQATSSRIQFGGASVSLRLARGLHQLVVDYGRVIPGGILIDVPLTQAELGALIDASEISIHRELTALRDKGVLGRGTRGRVLVLNQDELRRLSLSEWPDRQ